MTNSTFTSKRMFAIASERTDFAPLSTLCYALNREICITKCKNYSKHDVAQIYNLLLPHRTFVRINAPTWSLFTDGTIRRQISQASSSFRRLWRSARRSPRMHRKHRSIHHYNVQPSTASSCTWATTTDDLVRNINSVRAACKVCVPERELRG